MASLAVLLVILGCGAYQYFKGSFVKAFAMFMVCLFASVAAFGYFELLAGLLIKRGALVNWAQPLCFLVLFILAFTVLWSITWRLTRAKTVNLGLWPERIGRVIFGITSGLVIAGIILTALAMAPLSNNLPYRRFDANNPDAEKPNAVLLNADGFAAGLFSLLSSGSLSGSRSFAVLHSDFLNQLFLNRHGLTDKVPILTRGRALEVPKKAAWNIAAALKDSSGREVSTKSAHRLSIVRMGIRRDVIKDAGFFTLSQIRLVCTKNTKKPLSGRGKSFYPIGYMKTSNQLKTTKLTDKIKIDARDFRGTVKYIDFVFELPAGYIPAAIQFKQNNVAAVPPLVTEKNAPPVMPFIPQIDCAVDLAQLNPITSAKVYGLELSAQRKLLTGLELAKTTPRQWQNAETKNCITKARFDRNRINFVRAELMRLPLAKDEKSKGFAALLKPLKGYSLLCLKCNNPSTTAAITAEQLPVLIDVSGRSHHPVGVIASGRLDGEKIYQIDYCSVIAKDDPNGLVIAKDGSVAKSFVETIWLTEKTKKISALYLLYLVKNGKGITITSVRQANSQTAAGFKKYEGFIVK